MDLWSLWRALRYSLKKALKKCHFAYGHRLYQALEEDAIVARDSGDRIKRVIAWHSVRRVYGAVAYESSDFEYCCWILIETDDDICAFFLPHNDEEFMDWLYSKPGFRRHHFEALAAEDGKTVFPTVLWP